MSTVYVLFRWNTSFYHGFIFSKTDSYNLKLFLFYLKVLLIILLRILSAIVIHFICKINIKHKLTDIFFITRYYVSNFIMRIACNVGFISDVCNQHIDNFIDLIKKKLIKFSKNYETHKMNNIW